MPRTNTPSMSKTKAGDVVLLGACNRAICDTRHWLHSSKGVSKAFHSLPSSLPPYSVRNALECFWMARLRLALLNSGLHLQSRQLNATYLSSVHRRGSLYCTSSRRSAVSLDTGEGRPPGLRNVPVSRIAKLMRLIRSTNSRVKDRKASFIVKKG